MKKYILHTDGGHGWLAVKRSELEKLGLLDKISSYSYQRGGTVYLEEDCDMGLFHNAMGFTDSSQYETKYCDKRHPIRSYAPFSKNIVIPASGLRIMYGGRSYTMLYEVGGSAWMVAADSGEEYRMKRSQIERSSAIAL